MDWRNRTDEDLADPGSKMAMKTLVAMINRQLQGHFSQLRAVVVTAVD